jgi:hypothetical protein
MALTPELVDESVGGASVVQLHGWWMRPWLPAVALVRMVACAILVGGLALLGTATAAHAQTTVETVDSFAESLIFNPATVVTTNIPTYSTQILGRMSGGSPLFDQTFGVAFGDPIAQAGVAGARAAVTVAGGPGVLIGNPVLTASSSTTVSSTSVTTYSLVETRTLTPTVVVTFGPETIAIGQLSTCNVSGLPGPTRPTCQNLPGTPRVLPVNTLNFNITNNTAFVIDETTATTNNISVFEQWTVFGTVQPFGMVHTAVQSGGLDANARFLRRMGDDASAGGATGASPGPAHDGFFGAAAGIHTWFEGYGIWSKARGSGGAPGEDRTQQGFAAGLAGLLSPNLTLGVGLDHGNTSVWLDNGYERGNLGLTQFGVYAGYKDGPLFANLAATLGGGSAATQNDLLGKTTANYGVLTAGLLGEIGYIVQVDDWSVIPSLGFDYTVIRNDGFVETGTLPLTAAAHTTDRTRLWASLEVGRKVGGFDWMVYGRLVGIISGDQRVLPVTYGNVPMTVTGNPEPRIGVEAGTRLSYIFAPGAELFARYDARFRDGFTAHAATAGFKVKF